MVYTVNLYCGTKRVGVNFDLYDAARSFAKEKIDEDRYSRVSIVKSTLDSKGMHDEVMLDTDTMINEEPLFPYNGDEDKFKIDSEFGWKQ